MHKNSFQIILNNKYISNLIFKNVYKIHKIIVGIGNQRLRYHQITEVEWMLLNNYNSLFLDKFRAYEKTGDSTKFVINHAGFHLICKAIDDINLFRNIATVIGVENFESFLCLMELTKFGGEMPPTQSTTTTLIETSTNTENNSNIHSKYLNSNFIQTLESHLDYFDRCIYLILKYNQYHLFELFLSRLTKRVTLQSPLTVQLFIHRCIQQQQQIPYYNYQYYFPILARNIYTLQYATIDQLNMIDKWEGWFLDNIHRCGSVEVAQYVLSRLANNPAYKTQLNRYGSIAMNAGDCIDTGVYQLLIDERMKRAYNVRVYHLFIKELNDAIEKRNSTMVKYIATLMSALSISVPLESIQTCLSLAKRNKDQVIDDRFIQDSIDIFELLVQYIDCLYSECFIFLKESRMVKFFFRKYQAMVVENLKQILITDCIFIDSYSKNWRLVYSLDIYKTTVEELKWVMHSDNKSRYITWGSMNFIFELVLQHCQLEDVQQLVELGYMKYFEQVASKQLLKCPLKNIKFILNHKLSPSSSSKYNSSISPPISLNGDTNNNKKIDTIMIDQEIKDFNQNQLLIQSQPQQQQQEQLYYQKEIFIKYSGSDLASTIGNSLEVLIFLLGQYHQNQQQSLNQSSLQHDEMHHSYSSSPFRDFICDTIDEALEAAFCLPLPYQMECIEYIVDNYPHLIQSIYYSQKDNQRHTLKLFLKSKLNCRNS